MGELIELAVEPFEVAARAAGVLRFDGVGERVHAAVERSEDLSRGVVLFLLHRHGERRQALVEARQTLGGEAVAVLDPRRDIGEPRLDARHVWRVARLADLLQTGGELGKPIVEPRRAGLAMPARLGKVG